MSDITPDSLIEPDRFSSTAERAEISGYAAISPMKEPFGSLLFGVFLRNKIHRGLRHDEIEDLGASHL